MKQSTFLSIAGGLSILFGLTMLIAPNGMLGMYGVTLDEGGILVARSLGSLLFSLGVVNLSVRSAEDSVALRAVLYGNLAVHVLTGILDLMAVTSGVVNAQGWGAVVLHIVIGAGFAYFLYWKPRVSS